MWVRFPLLAFMTKNKVREVLTIYQRKLETISYLSPYGLKDIENLLHCKEMIPKIFQFLLEDRMEKVFRWLGFIQGVLYSNELYTIEEMKEHNKP